MPETPKGPKRPAKNIKAAQEAAKAIGKAKVAAKAVKAPTPAKRPAHRPAEYTDKIAHEICWRLAQGESLVSICSDDHLPHCATIYRWLNRFPAFCEMYTRAREEQADTNADEILSIADQMPPKFTDEKGRVMLDHTYIAWQKNRIEARKWTAAKLKPRKYGDRMAVEGVEGGAPIKTEEQNTMSERLFDIIRNLEMSKRAG